MSSGSSGTFSPYKCQMEGEVAGSKPTRCMSNLPIKKRINLRALSQVSQDIYPLYFLFLLALQIALRKYNGIFFGVVQDDFKFHLIYIYSSYQKYIYIYIYILWTCCRNSIIFYFHVLIQLFIYIFNLISECSCHTFQNLQYMPLMSQFSQSCITLLQRTAALKTSLKENDGWQKLIKRGVHTLKKPQYQVIYLQ